MKSVCALLGEKLAHSYSPQIHALLGDYPYTLSEKRPEEVAYYLENGGWTGINVTIPYKKTVLPYMDELSPTAADTQSVNTVIRRPDGSLYGDNTDVYGFTHMVRLSGADVGGKKALVLGSGGSAQSVIYALKKLGANVVVISRSGENNYTNLDRHADARIIVNTTPLGMYPNNGAQALRLKQFGQLEAVFDLIYNPSRTALLLEADALGIPAYNGLTMLVAQAKRSSELFQDKKLDDDLIASVTARLSAQMQNVALIGMPGAGKSCAAKELSRLTGRRRLDCDAEIARRSGRTAAELIKSEGETRFRQLESEILADFSKQSGAIIDTGGGCVTVEGNYPLLRQNSVTVWLKRDLNELSTKGRPLSQTHGVEALYRMREPLYQRFCDLEIDVLDSAERTARAILDKLT